MNRRLIWVATVGILALTIFANSVYNKVDPNLSQDTGKEKDTFRLGPIPEL